MVVLTVALVVALGRVGRGEAARFVLFAVFTGPHLVTYTLATDALTVSRARSGIALCPTKEKG